MRLTEAEAAALLGPQPKATRRRQDVTPNLLGQCRAHCVPVPTLEFRFHETRRWRFDLAWPAARLAVEIDGGVFLPGGGRHSRGTGYRADCEKFAEAAIRGWRVIRILPEHVKSGLAIEWIQRALSAKES